MARFVVTSAFLLVAALCIQDTAAYCATDCNDFVFNPSKEGWLPIPSNNIEIKAFGRAIPYDAAMAACAEHGAILLENTAQDIHLNAMCLLNAKYNNMRVWMGSTLIDGGYKWTHGGTTVGCNWVKNQPDFANGVETCLVMNFREMGKYIDANCIRKRPYICQRTM